MKFCDTKSQRYPENALFQEIISSKDIPICQSIEESYNIFNCVLSTNKLQGSLAEVGVFSGASSYIISKSKLKDKKFYLFDTFEGLADIDSKKDGNLGADSIFAFSDISFIEQLLDIKNDYSISITKGYFPDSIKNEKSFNEEKFCFVHIDTDTYNSVLGCLEFFYNRMVKNGIILIHDYYNIPSPGVKKAVDLFFLDKEEHIIQLWDTQALIIKI